MKYLSIIILLILSIPAFGQTTERSGSSGYLAESEHYKFYSHFWFNMHHFFQQEALTLEVSKKSTIPQNALDNLSESDKTKLNRVIAFYKENLLDKDLRTSDYMSDFRKWIITQDEDKLSSIPDQFKEHTEQLQSVENLYRNVFWKTHHSANQKVLNNNLKLVKNTEKEVVKKLTNLTKQPWQEEKIRIDISFYAKSSRQNMKNRPYTSLFPTHVIMNSSGIADKPFGNWLEMLYHESSHHLIGSRSGFVGGTITDVAESSGGKPLRSLWHAYLFYFSGVVSKEALKSQGIEDYEMYMIRNKVFNWYLPYIEKYLPAYIDRTRTLKEATELINKDFLSDREKSKN